jgi:UDP:flavonoid glycosyltransferase YjiC (YdhE family)
VKILFTSRPLTGHLQPLLPLAEAAAARMHVVAFATGRPALSELRPHGYTAFEVGLPGDEARARFFAGLPDFDERPAAERRGLFWAEAFARIEVGPRLEDIERVVRDWKPDLVVHETAELAAPIAASAAGVPYATAGFGPRVDGELLRRAGAGAAPAWRSRGLEPDPLAGVARQLYLDPCPESLQDQPAPPVTQPVRITPRVEPNPGGAAEWLRPLPEHRAVYVTLGTIWNRDLRPFELAVEGLRELPVAVIVTMGASAEPDALGPQPANVHIHRFIPQGELLPFCDAVVHHGGSGTMLGVFAHGLPQLVVPQGADQFSNAQRVEAVGAGTSLLSEQLSPEAIRTAVAGLLERPAFRMAAGRVRDELERMPGPVQAIDRLEALVAAAA